MDKNTIKLIGADGLNDFLKRLPNILNNPKNLTKIFRENAKPLVKEAKALAPKKTGQLSRSIGFFTTAASRKVGGGYVGPKVRGAFRSKEKTGFYGAFIEYGGKVKFGGKGFGTTQEFMQPAYNNKKNTMMINLLQDAKKVMYKEIKRLRKFGTLGY